LPITGRIILVRHGETEANRLRRFAESDDISLTETGKGQAAALALAIREKFQPRRVFSSEFRRARETAGILARHFGLQPEVIHGLHERDFGLLRGQPYGHMGVMMRADTQFDPEKRWLWVPEGGESLETVRVRVIDALRRLEKLCPAEDVIVVSHGAVMESVAAHLANNWENAAVPDNCGMIVLEFSQLFS
jgi:broad specificity phosphatase PhoE